MDKGTDENGTMEVATSLGAVGGGAAAGTLAGWVAGPVGGVIGALAGAVAGAIVGRRIGRMFVGPPRTRSQNLSEVLGIATHRDSDPRAK
jgi:phage tail tape-measure protein